MAEMFSHSFAAQLSSASSVWPNVTGYEYVADTELGLFRMGMFPHLCCVENGVHIWWWRLHKDMVASNLPLPDPSSAMLKW